MKIRKLGSWMVVFLFWAVTPAALFGQNLYGKISGVVSDNTGASVGGCAVTLTNLDTAESNKITSDASGNYSFPNISPGRYKIQAEKSGFKIFVQQPIVVEIESGLKIDITLAVGTATETVEVTAQTPLLQPETNSLGQVIDQRAVTDLPLNGRNPIALTQLVPGVVPQGQPSAGNSSTGNAVGANPFALGDFQIGGGQSGQSQILIDGVPTNGAYLNVVTVIPTQDAIQEFKVQTNNLGPEYGRFAGGVINLSTKSGTNQFHGSAYEFIRNKVLNANDFFDNRNGVPRPPFTQNQFGGNAGGPVLKDKLFFFGGYEGFRLRKGSPFQGYVPTAAERGGDFSAVGSANTASAFQIYDATTSGVGGNPACNSTNAVCRTPFPNNIIPANRLDPTAVALLKYYPLPNLTGSSTANYATSYSTGGNIDQYNARADYALSQKQRIFGRYTQSKILSLPDSPYPGLCTDRCTETTTAKQISLGDSITLTPTSILDLHFGFTRYVYLRVPLTEGINLSQFGPNWATLAPEFTYTHVPVVCVSEVSNDGHWCNGVTGAGSGIGAHDNTYSFDPSFVKIIGKHTVKVGLEYRILQNNYYQTNEPAGQFQFDAGATAANPQNPANGTVGLSAAAGGNGYASFLLGYGSTTNTGNSNAVEVVKTADQDKYWAFYAGDTFNLSKKITLNLGARVDLQGNWTERYNRIVALDPTEASPLLAMSSAVGNAFPNLKGGYDLVASSRHPSRSPFPNWNHVSPRIGVSYQLDQNTVIRTGYGMFYLPVDLRWDDAPHNLFINSFTSPWLVAQSDGVTPKDTLSNPFPGGVTEPLQRNQSLIDVQGNGNDAAAPNTKSPYMQQWNLDVQRQFKGDLLLDVAYAASKGTNLPMHTQDIDQLQAQNLPQNAQDVANLTTLVPNPFAGNCTGCTGPVQSGNIGTNATTKAAQLLLPYPQFDDFSLAEYDNRSSSYNSMQLKVVKRFTAGAQVLASYTIAKLIDDTNNEINWLEAASPSWGDANAYNLKGERSLDGFDVSQRLVIGSIVDLPVGQGKTFGKDVNALTDKFIGGWGINTIITFQRGFPIIVGGCPGALSSSGIPETGCARPTRTAPSHELSGSKDQKLAEWYDTSVFTAGASNYYGYGTDSRVEPNIRGDGAKNFDFAAFKNIKFGPDGRFVFEFRGEFFNLFNRTQFNPPQGWGSQFGQVTGSYNLPRVIQFSGRVSF
jgi:carboxypeptidase family protein/TonB-dependent receptor-like protein